MTVRVEGSFYYGCINVNVKDWVGVQGLANFDINEIKEVKGGKVAAMIIVGKELGKLATSKAMEWYVKKYTKKVK